MKKLSKIGKYALITLLVFSFLLLIGFALRLYYFPKLQPWHTYVPSEMTAAELDKAGWREYIERENKIFEDVYREVILKTPADGKNLLSRYFEGSRIYPPSFKEDWNHSYVLVPKNPKGAVVLLHGLTDSPYSLRHVAQLYYKKGFVVLGPRMPGHGTVPAALTKITWQEWAAAVRLAVREAANLTPEGTPLHIVGFSQGGALAVKYALETLENDALRRPDRLILISPMIGITRFSRLAEISALPARIPGFEKAAWLSIIPEFNPFKFNSFPVNAVKQARLLITEMRRKIIRLHNSGRLNELPPITTFQSVTDYTVSTPALINDLYGYLQDNESELVLFDINRDTAFLPLVRPVFVNMMSRMLPDLPQRYKITIIGNAAAGDSGAVERSAAPGGETFEARALGLVYPQDVFSLSHVSLPFPESDPLYGSAPDPKTKNDFGLSLGLISNAQGERGVLEINTNLFFRISSNPLFPYVAERIDGLIDGVKAKPANVQKAVNPKAKITEAQYDAVIKETDSVGSPF